MQKDKGYNRIRIGFIIAAICITFFVAVTYLNMQHSARESIKQQTSLENLLYFENLVTEVQAMETGQRGYVLTGDEEYLKTHNTGLANIRESLGYIAAIPYNDPISDNRRQRLADLVQQKITNSSAAVQIRKEYGFDSAAGFIKTRQGELLMNRIRQSVSELESVDRELLKNANAESEKAAKATAFLFIALALFFFVILFINYKVIVADLKRRIEDSERLKYNTSLINSISDPIITTDRDLRITRWNTYAEEIYGWKEGEVKGKKVKDVLQTTFADPDKDNLHEFLDEGVWKGEVMQRHKDGRPVYVLVTTTALKNDSNELIGAVAVIRDITERKKIEEQLRLLTLNLEKEVNDKVAELNNVFNRITDAFIALDNEWRYTYVNEKAALLHGVNAEELIGKNIWETFPDVVNEDFYKALHTARETMQPMRVELYYSKTEKWFEDLIYPSTDGISVYYHDVTDKKQTQLELQDAEAKFRNLVEESSVGVYIVQNQKFVYANPCFADIFGYSADYIMQNLRMLDLVIDGDKPRVLEHIHKRLESDVKSMHYEFEGLSSNGNIIFAEVFGTRMMYNGEPAIIGTLINITERKKALARLQASEEALTLSNERFELVAKATNNAIWDWDISNDSITGNETFYALFNIRKDKKIVFEDFASRLHPEDRQLIIDNFKGALSGQSTYLTEEFRLRTSEGTYRQFRDRAYILYNGNEAYRMLGAMEDITVQKIAEQQLVIEKELSDSIINSLPGIFYLFNSEGKFYRWNNNFEQVTGYTPEEIVELNPLTLIPEEERNNVTEKVSNVFANGEDSIEAHIVTKYNDIILYYFSGMSINYEGEQCVMGIGFDLSEKLKSQQQLIQSEEKFRMLIEQASDGIFISNQMGDHLVVNSSAASLTGYSTDELLQMNMRDVMYEKDMQPSVFRIKEQLSGQTILAEKLMRRKDGTVINVEISSKLLPDGRFQGIVRDITARKHADEGLRYSEEKRRLIMNASLDAIVCIDLKGLITFWNPQAEKTFGWKAGEVYGQLLSSIIIPEKFRRMHDNGIANYIKTGQGNVFNKILELSAINRDGDEFPIELTVLPIKQGNEEFFCAFIRDITYRKKTEEEIRISEHKYRLLFDQNPMPMWMISLPGRNFLAVNSAAEEFYGYSKDEFLSMNIKDLRPEADTGKLGNIIDTYKLGINNTGIWEHKKKDGSVVKVSLITHDIIYQGKHAKLVLANDMTEKIIAEEKLKSSHTELRQLATHLQNIREEERTHMAREIHDELGQQLTGLKMDIAWINRKMHTADPEVKNKMTETLKLIDGTVKTVRRIATQLRPSILDDLGVVAAMEWQSEEFQRRSQIESVFKSSIPNIYVSPELATGFFRIYQESLTNVSRHSKATKVEAVLSMNDGLLILSITDNGIGFNPRDIESKKTLGLLGMKERTLIMGGTYEITSKPGKGTTVVIIVPIQNKP